MLLLLYECLKGHPNNVLSTSKDTTAIISKVSGVSGCNITAIIMNVSGLRGYNIVAVV